MHMRIPWVATVWEVKQNEVKLEKAIRGMTLPEFADNRKSKLFNK